MEIIIALLANPQIQQALVTALVTVITIVTAFLGKRYHTVLDRRINTATLTLLQGFAADAVRYAEQTGVTATGEEKKTEALRVANVYLENAGIKSVTAEQIEAAIEAAVYDTFNNNGGFLPILSDPQEAAVPDTATDPAKVETDDVTGPPIVGLP